MKKPRFDYKKFYELYFEQPDEDPTEEFMAETFNISVENVHTIGGLLCMLTCMKDEDPVDPRGVKRLIESEIITADELAAELGVTSRHIRRLCKSVESSKFALPKTIKMDNRPEAIARAKSV